MIDFRNVNEVLRSLFHPSVFRLHGLSDRVFWPSVFWLEQLRRGSEVSVGLELLDFGRKKIVSILQYSEKKIESGIENWIEWTRRVMVQSAIREKKIKTTRRL